VLRERTDTQAAPVALVQQPWEGSEAGLPCTRRGRATGVVEQHCHAGIQAADESGGGQPSAVMDFLSSSEGIQLSTAFMSIKDVKVRRRILDLVRTISGENHGNGIA